MRKLLTLLFLKLGLGLFLFGTGFSSIAQAAPPLSVYGNLPGFEMAAMSPTGDRVAIIGIIANKRQLVVLGKDKALLATAEIAKDSKIRGLNWAGDDLVLLRTSVTATLGIIFTAHQTELSSMTIVPLDGSKSWSVFQDDKTVRGGINGFHGTVFRDGKWYGYFGGATLDFNDVRERYLKSTNPVLYEVDLQTGKFKRIAHRIESRDGYRLWLVDAQGTPSITLDYFSNDGKWNIYNSQRKTVASGTQRLGAIGLIGFGITPGTFIYSERESDTGEARLYEVPIAGGAKKEIFKDENIRRSFFDERTRMFMGYQSQGDTPAYHFFDSFHQQVADATQKAFPDRSVYLVDWNDTFDRLIVRTEGARDARTWWTINIRTGDAVQLGKSYPIPAKDVGPMKMIKYKAEDGTDIAAVLTLPPGIPAKNLPVIMLPHGGPAARDYPVFDYWAQAFASRGYAVLQPNFRGSTGYGATFRRAGRGEWGRKMQSDISDGLAQLVKDGIVDPDRTCIVGGSYGGYAALAGVTLQQGLYKCAVSVAGVSDLAKLIIAKKSRSAGDNTLSRRWKEQLGSSGDMNAVSPIKFADRADAPILLIHGKDDTVVLFDQSNDMASALRRAGKSVELVTLPEGDHWLSKSETRLAMLEATVAFLEKHNPPGTPGQ